MLNMKRILLSIVIMVSIASCYSGGKLVYDFEMTHPVQSKELFYENDTLSITFTIKPDWIEFVLYNKLYDGIKISWDELSLSHNGKAYRVIHKETGVLSINQVQPPTTIPPRTTLTDAFVRTDKVGMTTGFGYNKPSPYIKNTFPIMFYNKKDKAEALSNKGLKMTLFMPYYVAGKYISMYYDIYLKDIQATK